VVLKSTLRLKGQTFSPCDACAPRDVLRSRERGSSCPKTFLFRKERLLDGRSSAHLRHASHSSVTTDAPLRAYPRRCSSPTESRSGSACLRFTPALYASNALLYVSNARLNLWLAETHGYPVEPTESRADPSASGSCPPTAAASDVPIRRASSRSALSGTSGLATAPRVWRPRALEDPASTDADASRARGRRHRIRTATHSSSRSNLPVRTNGTGRHLKLGASLGALRSATHYGFHHQPTRLQAAGSNALRELRNRFGPRWDRRNEDNAERGGSPSHGRCDLQ
jgi:hypothetical protein